MTELIDTTVIGRDLEEPAFLNFGEIILQPRQVESASDARMRCPVIAIEPALGLLSPSLGVGSKHIVKIHNSVRQ
jgi:hypothetical protein